MAEMNFLPILLEKNWFTDERNGKVIFIDIKSVSTILERMKKQRL